MCQAEVGFNTNKNICTTVAHPWLRNDSRPVPLDILIYKLVKSYLHATPFKRAALKVSFLHSHTIHIPFLLAGC